jgi:shikimate kinase
MNVVLIGFSGTGKSRVGRVLAGLLGWEFVDTDLEVERAVGMRIHDIFAAQGEPGFRSLERAAVRAALSGDSRVIAVGGGAVLDPGNRQAMRSGNLVVLLEAAAGTLHDRLAAAEGDEPRPLLAGEDPRGRIASLKAEREPIYRETARIVVDTDGIDADEVAARIAGLLSNGVESQKPGESDFAPRRLEDR